MGAPNYIKGLLRPNGQKSAGRKIWSVDLETVWLPFFTATNTDGLTVIPHDVLGSPLRLSYETDGSVRFNTKTGKPVVKVAKDLADSIRLVRENFVAGLQQFAASVQSKEKDAYIEQVRLNIEAGRPIVEKDRQALDMAIAAQIEAAMAEATPTPTLDPTPDLEGEPASTPEHEGELVTA